MIKRFLTNKLILAGAVVFAGTMVGNIGSYAYHLLMGRILGPEGYGVLSSLMSLLYIFGVPTIVFQTILTKYFSSCKAHGALGEANDLFRRATKIVIQFLVVAGVIFFAASPFIAGYLRIPEWRYLVWVFVVLAFSTLGSVNYSLVQGLQLFIWSAVFSSLPVIIKLGISLPVAHWGVEWTLGAGAVAAVVGYALFFPPIVKVFSTVPKRFKATKLDAAAYGLPTFLAILGVTSIYSTDIVLVKHFFSPFDAGIYSAVSILGKVVFYASAAVVTVLFPVLSERKENGTPTHSLVLGAVGAVAAISSALTAVYFLFPSFVTHMLFGSAYDAVPQYLGLFGVFISVFSVANVMASTCLALGKTGVWVATVAAAVTQIVLVYLFHASLTQVIWSGIAASGLMVLGSVAIYAAKRYTTR